LRQPKARRRAEEQGISQMFSTQTEVTIRVDVAAIVRWLVVLIVALHT